MKKVPSVLQAEAPPFEVSQASIRLDGYYIKELHCGVRGNLDDKVQLALGTGLHIQQPGIMECPTITTNLQVDMGQNKKDPTKFRVLLRITSDEKKEEAPYIFDLHLMGYFSVNTEELFFGMDVWVYHSAIMILYSTAREVIASVTGRGPFPAIMLPTLTFGLTESAKAALQAGVEAEQRRVSAKKQSRQLPPTTKKPSKKKASKKGAKK